MHLLRCICHLSYLIYSKAAKYHCTAWWSEVICSVISNQLKMKLYDTCFKR